MSLTFNLEHIPFTTYKSYLVISKNNVEYHGKKNDSGLYIRTIHRSSYTPFVARLIPTRSGEAINYEYTATPTELIINTGESSIKICFADDNTILFNGSGDESGLTLDFLTMNESYDYIYEIQCKTNTYYMANCYKNNRKYLIQTKKGITQLDQVWCGCTAEHSIIRVSAQNSEFFFSLTEIITNWDENIIHYDYEQSLNNTSRKFDGFYSKIPSIPERYADTGKMAAYVNWSSIVRKEGFLTKDTMYMSKNWMCSVWSWDHCFNAIALSYNNPLMAWDQFMLIFDYQDSSGLIPDSVNDSHITWNYCKPPIHGWALFKMMQHMKLTSMQISEAYHRLGKWTNWWLYYRDHDNDGICEYNHGNDSGWDNSTVFLKLPPIETPELQAYLIIQMEVLADLARRLGKKAESKKWIALAEKTFTAMISHLFYDGYPHAVRSITHEKIECKSLLPYESIILGKRLPSNIINNIVNVLKSDRFLTNYGYATESPSSKYYESDGYWRGPIWAPSTLILLDGLNKCGEHELVKETAEKFCKMIQRSGFAENFDALTGKGLRDRAYTWTSSVFLILAHDYLL